jgi:glycosyltransferase involved in cell wall biosynthesis
MNALTLKIIVRVCDLVFSNHKKNTRPYGADKYLTIIKSLSSIKNSIPPLGQSITVIADNTSDDLIDYIRKNITDDIHITNGGASASLQKQLELALLEDDDTWVYLCEDDYLHHPQAMTFISEFLENRETYVQLKKPKILAKQLHTRPIIIHPPDYPDRYKASQLKPTWIFKSKYCHWRMVDKTTHSFILQASTVRKYYKHLYKSTIGPSDAQLSKRMYGGLYSTKPLCISPIPGLSTHLTDGVMTPFVDWKKIWDETV